MKNILLSLDLSNKASGWATFDLKTKELLNSGVLKSSVAGTSKFEPLYKKMVLINRMAEQVMTVVEEYKPSEIIIEEVTGSRFRSQKTLDMLHYSMLTHLLDYVADGRVGYMDVGGKIGWRPTLKMKLSSEDKKHNRKVRKAGRKKEVVNWKTLSVRFVKAAYGLEVQHDEADAISLGTAHLTVGGEADTI